MVQQLQIKRKRGRPRKVLVEQLAEGESPLWAIVDQLTLIRDELHHLNQYAENAEKAGAAIG
jgi:hypothetical protein